MTIEITVPTLGESITEATVSQWFKDVGDSVDADEPILELETDKVTVEVPMTLGAACVVVAAPGFNLTGRLKDDGVCMGKLLRKGFD